VTTDLVVKSVRWDWNVQDILRLTSLPVSLYISLNYMALIDDETTRKKGSAEVLVLAQLEDRPRHGYEVGVEIERRSGGAVSFQIASLYPVLYRLEKKGLIAGHWVEKAGQRRRRYYKLTSAGRRVLAEQRRSWSTFMAALQRAGGLENA
jgi:PadR family transcriptional regulator, regulatory protein PadR